ncbi:MULTISPECIES: RNA methyltransferase [unclassified Dietzia]|uniref:TrmH family RNA methyltransferase n=1 Tax=unclassified Dietzia TaxID=2617939 RepID=UPI000D21A442|nr:MULTISPECIES: RNA methyltransferase [unclassified Dietzia]AVZ39295.1 RNA methyltransferase [Dietzia sp. JS16-p6b]QGW24540.1 tRNA/rRNA methyltransferase SpoU [Dietzia sp. DQ12-45-1b]
MTHSARPGQGTGRPADPFTERTPRVVSASKLHRAAARRRAGRFLAEGANSVEAALAAGVAIEVFCGEDSLERFSDLVTTASASGLAVSVVTDRAVRALSDTVSPTGIVALCRSVVREPSASDDSSASDGPPASDGPDDTGERGPRLVAVGQALAEPGNVGTLVRVADALGADAVWLTEGAADPENTKAVRASAGSLFHLPVVRGVAESDLIGRAHRLGLQVAVATGDGEVDIEHAGQELSRPTAWVFGNEAHGVPAELAARADLRVRIPIRGRAESLNIVTAASICLHTSARLQAASS